MKYLTCVVLIACLFVAGSWQQNSIAASPRESQSELLARLFDGTAGIGIFTSCDALDITEQNAVRDAWYKDSWVAARRSIGESVELRQFVAAKVRDKELATLARMRLVWAVYSSSGENVTLEDDSDSGLERAFFRLYSIRDAGAWTSFVRAADKHDNLEISAMAMGFVPSEYSAKALHWLNTSSKAKESDGAATTGIASSVQLLRLSLGSSPAKPAGNSKP